MYNSPTCTATFFAFQTTLKSVPLLYFQDKKASRYFFFLGFGIFPAEIPTKVVEFRFLYWFQSREKEHDLAGRLEEQEDLGRPFIFYDVFFLYFSSVFF